MEYFYMYMEIMILKQSGLRAAVPVRNAFGAENIIGKCNILQLSAVRFVLMLLQIRIMKEDRIKPLTTQKQSKLLL